MRRFVFVASIALCLAACNSSRDGETTASEEQALGDGCCAQRCHDECGHKGRCLAACVKKYCGCPAGTANCDSDRSNACETTIASDVSNCGACGNACPSYAHAQPTCSGGTCGSACAIGFGDCNGDVVDGCETELASTTNCGACGNACPAYPNTLPACTLGECTTTCVVGFANCDGDVSNGCESALSSDASNCGACGNVCPTYPNTATTCSDSRCGTTCSPGYSDCDHNLSNGCETLGACASTIACTTLVYNVSGGVFTLIQTISEPQVTMEWGSTSASILLLSDGVRAASSSSTYLTLTGGPTSYAGTIPGFLPPVYPDTTVRATVSDGDATLSGFTASTRPSLGSAYQVRCTTGTATLIAAP